MHTYERVLRVPEYFVFDPTGRYVKEQLRGYRLDGGAYQVISPRDGRLHSEQLGLEIVVSGSYFRFVDPATGILILSPEEARKEAEALAAAEIRARQAAEAEVARLRAELDAIRNQAT